MNSSSADAIATPNVYETKRIRLISPILHIGSEVSQLNPFEYVDTGNKVYLPNSDALARELYKRGKLQNYIYAIEHREPIIDLLNKAFGDKWWETKSDGRPIFPETKIDEKWTQEKISNLRPMIRNGFGQLYIPGSSIKGAIRTAIAYYLLKYPEKYNVPQQQKVSEIEHRLRKKLESRKLEKKKESKKLFMDELFTNFQLVYQGKVAKGKTESSNTDFMRAIHVTDSTPLIEETLPNKNEKECTFNIPVVAKVLVSSYDKNGKIKRKNSIFTEMVHNVRTEFTLTLDTKMLKWFQHKSEMIIPFEKVNELLNICQEFAQEQWDGEYDYWNAIKNSYLDFSLIHDCYEQENCPYTLRMGWGTGMNGTTIGWLLNDDLRSEIRDACGIAAPGFEAPKSRRTVIDSKGNIRFAPGWVKFKTIKSKED